LTNIQLFFACVAIWGSTWLAITFQLGSVAPEASVFYRFLLASLILFVYCRARGLKLAYNARQHVWLAAQGLTMFSASYVLVYHAEALVVSGLVAVGYSASPLLNMLGVRIFYGTPMRLGIVTGALLGLAGITLVFWPEFGTLSADSKVVLGALFTALSVLIAATGSVLASRNMQLELPVWQSLSWGMLYGSGFTLLYILASGTPLGFESSPRYVLSLLYLAVAGSILAFACYYILLGRIGPARAGYIGVMVPIMALAVSALFEGFAWHAETWAGVALSVVGNMVILRTGKS
jgi:drug/metabolite transporter (DMT)-like permease